MAGKTGLYSHADRPALALSGGQQKRLAVARALLKSPEVLLADEVTAHLDAKQGALVEQLLVSICKMTRSARARRKR